MRNNHIFAAYNIIINENWRLLTWPSEFFFFFRQLFFFLTKQIIIFRGGRNVEWQNDKIWNWSLHQKSDKPHCQKSDKITPSKVDHFIKNHFVINHLAKKWLKITLLKVEIILSKVLDRIKSGYHFVGNHLLWHFGIKKILKTF